MAPSFRDLRPEAGERGLASWSPDDVSGLLGAAWQGVIELARTADLGASTRLPGWTARDILVHLGRWSDEGDELAALELQARTSQVTSVDDGQARNVGVLAAHHDASRRELAQALVAARDHATRFLASPDAPEIGRRLVGSRVGQLPLTGLLMAQTIELAVHVLDISAVTGEHVADGLLQAGVGALTDVTGALAAGAGIQATLALVTPHGSWATGSDDQGHWTTLRLDLEVRRARPDWPAVLGEAADLLDTASGRALAVQMLATRRLRVHRPAGLLRLVPALEPVPGLPGGSALRASLRALSQTGRLVGRMSSGVTNGLTRGVSDGVRQTLRRR